MSLADSNEYFSGFANIKHNDWVTIIGLYGIMKYVFLPPLSSIIPFILYIIVRLHEHLFPQYKKRKWLIEKL